MSSKRKQPEPNSDPLECMLAKGGNLELQCEDGSIRVVKEVLALASPAVLAGAVEALGGSSSTSGCVDHASNSRSGSGSRKAGPPNLKVDGKVAHWKLILRQLYPYWFLTHRNAAYAVITRSTPSLEELHAMLPLAHKYDITNLLAYILSELSTQLQGRLSLDPNSATHNVFTWLATADSLQLDSLRDACIDALGTYLLPGFASHAKHYTAAIARLPGPTAARVVCATARCARCVARVVEMDARSKVCAQYCPGRTQPMFAPVQMSPGQYVTLATGVCGMCSFTPSNPRYVVYKHHCPYCGLLREVAE